MNKSETQDNIRLYLNDIILDEQQNIIEKYKSFYEKNRINPVMQPFLYMDIDEYFFIILEYQGYGVYFNDIEEGFGVCRLNHNLIDEYAEFANNSLNGAVTRLNELLADGSINKILSRA